MTVIKFFVLIEWQPLCLTHSLDMKKDLLSVFQYWRKVDPDFKDLVRRVETLYSSSDTVKLLPFQC